jgi:cell division protein ZipA
MDKELLRIAIIGTGLIIIVGMIISAYLKDKQAHEGDEDEYYDDEFDDGDFEESEEFVEPIKKQSITESLKNVYSQKVQQFQKSIQPIAREQFEPQFDIKSEPPKKHKEPEEPKRVTAPSSVLQFSVITQGNEDFNVAKIFHVLEGLGLEYGSMKVFELIDENRIVHFCVADMDAPGTFPDEDLENHYCSGVTFFMDFDGLENPRDIFEDYVHTAALFAEKMDGQVLDHRRQPLTDAMVNAIRNNLDNYPHS